MSLAERIVEAVESANREYKRYSGTRIGKYPNLSKGQEAIDAHNAAYPYRTEESFTVPAVEAVLSAEQKELGRVLQDIVYVSQDGGRIIHDGGIMQDVVAVVRQRMGVSLPNISDEEHFAGYPESVAHYHHELFPEES